MMVLFLLLCPGPGWADQASQTAPNPDDQLKVLDLGQIQDFVQKMDNEIQGAIPRFDFKNVVVKLVQGKLDWRLSDIFLGLCKLLFKEVVANLSLIGKLVVLAVICAVLQNLMSSFEKGTTGKLAYSVSYLVLITLAVGTFGLAVNIGRDAVDQMTEFMQALLPVLLTLLAAMGGVASTALFHPIILGSITLISTLMKNIVLPLIFFSAILGILNNISDKFKVSRLADLFKSASMWIMGLFSTIFLGLLAIQGVAGGVADGVAMRTAKFATDAFIPVVGGMLSDALEAVVGSSLLIKNAVGVAGVIVIFILTALPLLKILALAFVYRLSGALIQPIGEKQMADCLTGLGGSLLTVFAAVATVGLLFFFAITIVVGVGNMTTMLR